MFKQVLRTLLILGGALLLSSCGIGFFCHTETYTYNEYIPIYLSDTEINEVESQAPRDIVNPGALYLHGNYVLISEREEGIHIIDNSDRTKPENIAFIQVPGNHDLLVRQDETGTVLYADNYMNLLAIDMTKPDDISVLKRVKDVFQSFYSDYETTQEGRFVGYEEKEVTQKQRFCPNMFSQPSPAVPEAGDPTDAASPDSPSQGGSLARFTGLDDFLYTIDQNFIQSFKIETLADPITFNRVAVDFGIETLWAYRGQNGDQVYVGGNQGMYIMDASDPSNLKKQGEISHVQSCDPVVVQDDIAYVTLQGSCFNQSNRLEIIDVSKPEAPKLIVDYALQEPYGLGVDDDYLFICDGTAGLKVYENAREPESLKLIHQFDEIQARDIIPYGGNALVIAKNGFFQYDYSNLAQGEMKLLSSIPVVKEGQP